ncbi:hypothetical protein O9993_14180 [Vibrio lentus]|nr:hypothetical protein [Vibrio lentus]
MKTALVEGIITVTNLTYLLSYINTGTNLPSVATPNGQAAFLFLLTSALAPLIRLSYGRMVVYHRLFLYYRTGSLLALLVSCSLLNR